MHGKSAALLLCCAIFVFLLVSTSLSATGILGPAQSYLSGGHGAVHWQ